MEKTHLPPPAHCPACGLIDLETVAIEAQLIEDDEPMYECRCPSCHWEGTIAHGGI